MVTVGGLLASAVVKMAGDKLGSAIAEQASLVWNVREHMEDMKNTLATIKAVLKDAERRSIREELVRLWLKRLKNAAYEISDMLDKFQDMSTQQQMTGIIPIVIRKISQGNEMKKMREKLRKFEAEHTSFNFMQTTITICDQKLYDSRETSEDVNESDIIGRDADKLTLVGLLSSCRNTEAEQARILPIYGLGGIGKSTLAGLVYRDTQFKGYDHRVWVYVSQMFDLIKIGNSIISQLSTERKKETNSRELISKYLDDLLCGKKVLVVLDDLWEDKESELNKLKTMLRSRNGSTIDVIVTTRREKIASRVCTGNCKPYELKPLEKDICWGIIKRYSQFENKANKERLQPIGMSIAEKCGGVALAAQALGRTLKKIEDIHGWSEIDSSDIWMNENPLGTEVLPSLQLSYDRMLPTLRLCFSYCAIFPKGHDIVEADLIHQWAAMDFVQQPSKGKEYINELLGMSFLQHSKLPSTSQEHVVRYTMHDLVHDFARLTMADELIVFDVAPQKSTHEHKYCRYSLLRKYDQTMKLAHMPSKLRALHLSDCRELDIPSGAFSFAKCLRILDFSECSGTMLPSTIGRLRQLRCIIAPRMKNGSLPVCITELSKLQYLNINGSSQISALPESIGKLGCLKYLGLPGCSAISKLPESFGDLKCMVHLAMSGCSLLTELPHSIGNLTQLQHLELSGCSSLKALPDSLCVLTQLQYLKLSSCSCLQGLPADIGSLVAMQHLDMSGCYEIRELPESMTKLQSLSHLNLSGCFWQRSWCRSLACLRGLTALQHLDISHHNSDFSHDLDDLCNNYRLINLEYLDLSCNYELQYLPESIGNLKRLHTLDLSGSYMLMSLPESISTLGLKSLLLEGCSDELLDQASSVINYLQTLPVFKVRAEEVNGCSNLHLLEGINVSELRILSLENVRSLEEAAKLKLLDKHNLLELRLEWSTSHAVRLVDDQDLLEQLLPPRGLKSMHLEGYSCTSFPGWFMGIYSHLTNLVSVKLRKMTMCSNLPPLGQLPHLEKLELWRLPAIKRISREFCGGKGAFRRLVTLYIMFMDGLEEWDTTYSVEDAGVEEFMFPVLEKLTIEYCPRLRLKGCPPTFRQCWIQRSNQVIHSLEEAVHKISRAIKLDLIMNPDSCQIIRIFHGFPALQELNIYNYGQSSLPESMRQLTSLESLKLDGCSGISALPVWLGDLPSLKSLVIWSCDGIKSLPVWILPKLQKIEIKFSKELKKWCQSKENKTKLAHINVRLFGDDDDDIDNDDDED